MFEKQELPFTKHKRRRIKHTPNVKRRDISNTMLCVCVRLASYLNKCLGQFYTSVVIINGLQPDVILYRSRVVLQFYVFLTCGQIV